MVATVRNLTSSSATSEYFRNEGGYYTGKNERCEGAAAAARARSAEHRRASGWYGKGSRGSGSGGGPRGRGGDVREGAPGPGARGRTLRLGRLRDGQHEHRPGFDITFSAPKSVSLAALLPTEKRPRGDRAVVRAHDEAVKATLDWIEGDASGDAGGGTPRRGGGRG